MTEYEFTNQLDLPLNQLSLTIPLLQQFQQILSTTISFQPILRNSQILPSSNVIFPSESICTNFQQITQVHPPLFAKSELLPTDSYVPQINFKLIVKENENFYQAPTYTSETPNYALIALQIPLIFTHVPESQLGTILSVSSQLRQHDLEVIDMTTDQQFDSNYYFLPRILTFKYKQQMRKQFPHQFLDQVFNFTEQQIIQNNNIQIPIGTKIYFPFIVKNQIPKRIQLFAPKTKSYQISLILQSVQTQLSVKLTENCTVETFETYYLPGILLQNGLVNVTAKFQILNENFENSQILTQTFTVRELQFQEFNLQKRKIELNLNCCRFEKSEMPKISQGEWKFKLNSYFQNNEQIVFAPEIAENGLCKYREVPFVEGQFLLTNSEKHKLFTEINSQNQVQRPERVEKMIENAYEVEYIVARKPFGMKRSKLYKNILQQQFLIHWAGYSKADRSWEPEGNLPLNCCAIMAFDEYFGDVQQDEVLGLLGDDIDAEAIEKELVQIAERIFNEQG